jgi:hypothetical protein
MAGEPLLPAESLARYADAIVRASLGLEKGDTLVVQGEPEHRELLVALAESSTSSPPTRSSCGPGCCTARTTRSARSRRGPAAGCARLPARAALSP